MLAVGLCLPLLAMGGASADDRPTIGTEAVLDFGPGDGEAQSRSFALGGSVCGHGDETSWSPFDPTPGRFSLCPGSLETASPDEPELRWDLPAEPAFRPRPSPAAPLRGVRNELAPLGTKFLRGTLIITGTAFASGVVLAVLPKQFSKWEDDSFSRGGSNFVRAWTEPPVWDGDVAFHNWIGHPYAGAFYYNMVRSQGGTIRQSFAFAVFQSVMWEYVIESFAEQPSIQDLIATPIMGSVVGELFHRWSVAILRKGRLNFGQKALVFFLNPSYVINNGYRPPE